MTDRVERDEDTCVLLGDAEQKLQAAPSWNAVPENLTGPPVDHEQVDSCGEEGTVRQELERAQLRLFLIEHFTEDTLTCTKGHRDQVEDCSDWEIFINCSGRVSRHVDHTL